MMDPPERSEVVLRFLQSVGRKAESDFYVQLFRREPKERFAALSIDANVARHALDVVALHLKFLADLGLAPLVVLGLFEPTDAPDHAARLLRRLRRDGVRATLVSPAEPEALATRITSASRGGEIPVLAFGVAHGAGVDARFDRLAGLLGALAVPKLIFLHRPGGLRQRDVLIPLVNVDSDAAALLGSRELSRKERAMVAQGARLIDGVRHKLMVTVTSPLNLLRELFTVKGAGTLLRKGVRVLRVDSYEGVDRARLEALITSSFGRAPLPAFFERPVKRIYLEEHYRGCAILTDSPWGAYLTKFATDREARGEGIARDLWEDVRDEHRVVFWRARANNPINEWYTKLADGLVKCGGWWVFWVGLATENIPAVIAWSLAQPVDLPAPEAGVPAALP